ncbi:MAG: glycosyltransferase family 9 protein [Fibrobacter sp.]|nr:glycosyltransferase family 9 protein [Fibrobacter sp.]
MKILCICPIGIGNYLLFYPACRLISSLRPEIELHLLALRFPIYDIGKDDHLWKRIHVIDPTKISKAETVFSLLNEIRSERYDASLSFFPSNKWQYNLLPYLCGIKERFAFRYPLKRLSSLSFLSNRKIPIDFSLHDLHQNVHLSALFLEKDLSNQKLVFPDLFSNAEEKEAEEMLKESLPVRIAVHPGSSAEHGMDIKRWSPERFAALADRICRKLGAEALIFGGPDEKELKTRVASGMVEAHRIIEPVNLRLTAALLKKCSICLCNDSGLMHMAACMGVPVAAAFGPTDEKRNGPVGNCNLILRKPTPGFPLWNARNVGVRSVPRGIDPEASLKALTVDDAWASVESWLNTQFF